MRKSPGARQVSVLVTEALRLIANGDPLFTDAVNEIPSPKQNPVRGRVTVRDTGDVLM